MFGIRKFSKNMLAEQGRRFERAVGIERPLSRYAALVPFYGGQGLKRINGSKAEYDAKVGNSHTMASPELKLWQLSTVLCSTIQYVGSTVVGVCSANDRDAISAFMSTSAEALGFLPETCRSNFKVILLDCEALPLHLPYHLLRWAQRELKGTEGSLRDYAGVYFTEADNVLFMGYGGSDTAQGSIQGPAERRTMGGGTEPPALTAPGVSSLMKARGKWCYAAPTRFEKRSIGSETAPFDGRSIVGQNACSEGSDKISV